MLIILWSKLPEITHFKQYRVMTCRVKFIGHYLFSVYCLWLSLFGTTLLTNYKLLSSPNNCFHQIWLIRAKFRFWLRYAYNERWLQAILKSQQKQRFKLLKHLYMECIVDTLVLLWYIKPRQQPLLFTRWYQNSCKAHIALIHT